MTVSNKEAQIIYAGDFVNDGFVLHWNIEVADNFRMHITGLKKCLILLSYEQNKHSLMTTFCSRDQYVILGICMPLDVTSYAQPEKLLTFDNKWGDTTDLKFANSKADLDDASTDTNLFLDQNSG